MVHFAETCGGFFSLADLSRQKAVWAEPLIGQYRDVTLYNTPPPTQGFTVIEMLNLLEPRKLYQKRFLGPDHLHLLVQAKQIAYHDRDRLLADPAYADVPIDRLISKEYARRRARLIDDKAAPPWDKVPFVWQPARRHRLRRRDRSRPQRSIADPRPMPRFLSGRFSLGEARDALHMEARFP